MRIRHPLLFGFLPLLIFLTLLLTWYGWKGIPMVRYNRCSQRILEKLRSLNERRPPSITPKLWDECVGWVVTAQGNICCSEEHASYEAMCRFDEQLDAKLKGDVDLDTIEWLGNRLAETGPHGQRYMTKWREQWKALQEWGKQQQ